MVPKVLVSDKLSETAIKIFQTVSYTHLPLPTILLV